MGSPTPGIPNAGLGEPLAGSVDAAGGFDRLNTASLKGFHLAHRPSLRRLRSMSAAAQGAKLQRLLRIN
jgi:hypothetical protein